MPVALPVDEVVVSVSNGYGCNSHYEGLLMRRSQTHQRCAKVSFTVIIFGNGGSFLEFVVQLLHQTLPSVVFNNIWYPKCAKVFYFIQFKKRVESNALSLSTTSIWMRAVTMVNAWECSCLLEMGPFFCRTTISHLKVVPSTWLVVSSFIGYQTHSLPQKLCSAHCYLWKRLKIVRHNHPSLCSNKQFVCQWGFLWSVAFTFSFWFEMMWYIQCFI